MIRLTVLSIASLFTVVGPALAQQPPATSPAVAASTPLSPDLKVASVKMDDGRRISKLIGSAVYNDMNEKIGSVDDLFTTDGKTIVMAIVSVGGFLGIGNKLVAIPYDRLHLETDKDGTKLALPGANKDALNAMPTFTYSG